MPRNSCIFCANYNVADLVTLMRSDFCDKVYASFIEGQGRVGNTPVFTWFIIHKNIHSNRSIPTVVKLSFQLARLVTQSSTITLSGNALQSLLISPFRCRIIQKPLVLNIAAADQVTFALGFGSNHPSVKAAFRLRVFHTHVHARTRTYTQVHARTRTEKSESLRMLHLKKLSE